MVLAVALLLAAAAADGGGAGKKLKTPAWDWSPDRAHVSSACLEVPPSHGTSPGTNSSVIWSNNSRGLFLAVPEGTPPEKGWPILLDLSIINFKVSDARGRPCGTQGEEPPDPVAVVCAAAFANVTAGCVAGPATWQSCSSCLESPATMLRVAAMGCRGDDGVATAHATIPNVCPEMAPLPPTCEAELLKACPARSSTRTAAGGSWRECYECVAAALPSAKGCARGSPVDSPIEAVAVAHCGRPSSWPSESHDRVEVEDFLPFDSPNAMGMHCTCINGSDFNCAPPHDNGHHNQPRPVNGKGECDLDIFFGGMWWQYIKQHALSNGIAVMVITPFYFDSWDAWQSAWTGGFDPPVFLKLAEFLAAPPAHAPPHFSSVDPHSIVLHGWSGGAQFVSWLFEVSASGGLPGLGLAGGIMTAGGSYNCYAEPPRSTGVCARCNASAPDDGMPHQCSSELVAHNKTPDCEYCCPDRFTEQWYKAHPADYKTHPWVLLVQTSPVDIFADPCAAKHYHDEMVRHGAHSELILVPHDELDMKCFSIGVPGDPLVPAEDTFSRFCASSNMSSLPHVLGFAGMVRPATEFMLGAFKNHSAQRRIDEGGP